MTTQSIRDLVPHAGTMCLLETVISWDDTHLQASAVSHRASDNPLRQGDRLGSLCGVEYAGQAMAAHGRLTGAVSEKPRMGFLIGLRDVTCHTDRLDSIEGDLTVEVEKLMGDEAQVIYHFRLTGGQQPLIEGRATVVLQGDMP